MKKHIKYTAALTFLLLAFAGCKRKFLEITPRGLNLESSYYRNQTEAFNGLVAIYDVVGWTGGGYVTKVNALDVACDDHLAGGGGANDITNLQVWSNYTLTPAVGPQAELWRKGYSGVFRANTLLQKMPGVPMDENLKKRYIAETKLLRAYFYFDLVRLFKNIPLFTVPVSTEEMYKVLQVIPEEVYTQMIKDITEAMPDLPATVPLATEGGRFTQAIAHAVLGKIYLQKQMFAQAASEFALVNGTPGGTSQYGNKLLANYNDLFKVSNKFNTESILEVGYTTTSAGGWGCVSCTEGNVMNILVGPRGYTAKTAAAPDYVSGWSFVVITPSLFNAIHYDPRYKATVANLDSLKLNNIADYSPGYNNTGYFLEKFAGRVSNKSTGGGPSELNFGQNMYEIRLADTYLLEAEALVRGSGDLARAAALLNAVRSRVGLPAVAATLANIKDERRLELVGEGHRWFDLVRWGDAAAVLATKGFVTGKHEVLPIPLLELENTKLVQNPNY
ncbi:MAG: RagB/SusD family nutrient uptake outer membrane protein [Bacteroidota bacterium]